VSIRPPSISGVRTNLAGADVSVGIVVNNAILLVEYIEIERKRGGVALLEAVTEAGRIRFRPILMTTLTTVFGMLPLALALGDGAELMQPLALAVIGGLLVSMVLTLFVVPSLYLIVNDITERRSTWLTGGTASHDTEAPEAAGSRARSREVAGVG
jgi:Cu/Ag efflux pump CusA